MFCWDTICSRYHDIQSSIRFRKARPQSLGSFQDTGVLSFLYELRNGSKLVLQFYLETALTNSRSCVAQTRVVQIEYSKKWSKRIMFNMLRPCVKEVPRTCELGILRSHHRPSIRCRWAKAFCWLSYSAKRTNPKPFDCFVRMSRFTCKTGQ